MEGSDRVVVCTVGDAAIREGDFYEAITFAMQESLPVVFAIEDNRYGISTPTEKHFPYRLGALGERCLRRVDGRDPVAIHTSALEAIEKARAGAGPTVLWCDVDRLCSHTSSDDQRHYRTAEDLAADQCRDPIDLLSRRLIAEGVMTKEEWTAELADIARRVDADYRAAEEEEDPNPDESESSLFGPISTPTAPPISFDGPTTMVTAVNQTLLQALEKNERVVMFGEDIEDPKGGVFGLTKGLSNRFPNRVMNSPLAEATIVGTAVGLAATGWIPVFEIQFIDFIAPALNQLMNQVGSLRWRTCGTWSCPMVIIAPYGAYLPGGGIWHSDSNDGIWAHIHGLNISIPGSPEDAAGLLWSAIHGPDPTLYLLPKHIFRKRMPYPAKSPIVAPGAAVVRRAGADVTVVSWGNCLELADQAADRVDGEGISVEIIDMRTLSPCDYKTVAASLSKTGRLVVVHEDSRTTGFGQCIIAEMTSRPEWFNLLLSAPQLVARQNVPVPYNPILEYAVLPDLDDVLTAVRETME